MNNALWSLMQAYQQRFNGVDKPQFYNAWEPHADPGMQFTPDASHPGMNDKLIQRPGDNGMQNGRQEFSAIARLLGVG